MKTCFCHLNVVWRPLAEERFAISTQSIHRWKVHSVDYNNTIPPLTIRVYLHSFSCYCIRNTRNVAKFQENYSKRIWPYSSSGSSKVIDLGVNGKPICDFLLVIIVTLAVSATVFEIFTLKDRKLMLPTPPLFDFPARGEPLSISGWNLSRDN